ncbi:hypothetical protein GGR88_000150 [Sphingomonas jejuensis]|jgi:hypothetical protein|uniref:Uncharacterized protein n=1 Tax=Sphingomonas jejuensis TaxID=904715 RepID=A0ABX0XIV1_9SPHN|nr:hypothetical protein [Sphingomonas jejuensis]NJC32676.1 hypothetical protein [Sphingomonas jejuensis]
MANDEDVHVTTTEARGASRGRPVGIVLVASLALIVVLFAIVYFTGGLTV